MTLHNSIISYLDNEIINFCKINRNYNFFRVGSSLYSDTILCNDVDYLVIDSSSKKNYFNEIDVFRKYFSVRNVIDYSIITFDPKINALFNELGLNIKKEFAINVEYFFSFGPITKNDSDINIHLAGPMNELSINYFFQNFPIFYMTFFKYNKALGTKTFVDLIDHIDYGHFEFKSAIVDILKRAIASDSFSLIKNYIRRIIVIENIFNDIPSPYHEAFTFVESLDDIESKNLLKYYCSKY